MRVLMISWEYPPVMEGGLGSHVAKLTAALAAHGMEVHVVTRGSTALPGEELVRGVRVHRVASSPLPTELGAFLRWVIRMNRSLERAARQLCETRKFDVLHSHDWLVGDAAWRLSINQGLPLVTTIHSTEFGRHQGWVQQPPQSQIHRAERMAARSADHVITCSDFMKEQVADAFGVAQRKLSTIPNGVDPQDLTAEPEPELRALRARHARPGEPLVLLAGRLVYEKGFHLALEALAQLVAEGLPLRFLVAGAGLAQDDLKRQSRQLGLDGVGSFAGWVPQATLASLYSVADVCVVPSIYEPSGLVALEAMAAGCPCLAADTGGLREIVPDDGLGGVRFAAGEPMALATGLRELLADDARRARIGARGRMHALAFTWTDVAHQTAGVYEKLTESFTSEGSSLVARLP
ncbi:MAG: glycosyltransferase family 4 protein [Solirubrobacteraceae bacterium]